MPSYRLNAAANVAGRVASGILWLVATPFVLRHLGAERFGIWSLFFAFNAYMLSFDLGVGRTMVRFVASQRSTGGRHTMQKTLRWGLWAAVALGLFWAVGMEVARGWISAAFHVPPSLLAETLDALFIFAIGVVIMFPSQALMASLQGFERIDLSNLCVTAGVVVHVVILFLALSGGHGLRGAALAGAISHLASGALAAVMIRDEVLRLPEVEGGKGPPLREMLHFSAALQVLGVLSMFQIQSGRMILGLLGNLTMVADYELASRVASVAGGMPILVRDPVIPSVSRVWDGQNPGAVRQLLSSNSWWVFMTSVLCLGLLWLTAEDITRMWLGPGHDHIAHLMRLWVLAYAANLIYAPGVAIARGMGIPLYEILSYAAALVASAGLAILWVPQQGTQGAVAAVAVSYCVGMIVFAVAFHRRGWIFPFWSWFWRDFVPPAAAGCLAVLACRLLLALPAVAGRLPSPGLVRGATTAVVFVVILAALMWVARFLARPRMEMP